MTTTITVDMTATASHVHEGAGSNRPGDRAFVKTDDNVFHRQKTKLTEAQYESYKQAICR